MVTVTGRDEPGLGRRVRRLAGALTVLADGRLMLMTRDEEVHERGEDVAALVGEERDRVPGTPGLGGGTATSAGCASRSRSSTATSA